MVGRKYQPLRNAPVLFRFPRKPRENRSNQCANFLQRSGLGDTPQLRHLGDDESRRRFWKWRTELGQLADGGYLGIYSPLGALPVYARQKILAGKRLPVDERGCRILFGIHGQRPKRETHDIPVDFARKQIHYTYWLHRLHTLWRNSRFSYDSGIVFGYHRSTKHPSKRPFFCFAGERSSG